MKQMKSKGYLFFAAGMLMLCAACLVFVLSSCGSGKKEAETNAVQTEAAEGDVISFTDDAGNEFSFAQPPKKTAVLFSSFAEIYVTAGGVVDVTVGESVERGFASEDAVLVDDGAGKVINNELLIAQAPELVIGSADIAAQAESAKLLNAAGIPAAVFRVECFDDYLRVLDIFCRLTQNREAYETYGVQIKSQIDALLSDAAEKQQQERSKRILFIRAGSSAKVTKAKTAEDHFAARMLSELGCANIADDAPVLLEGISIEEIMMQNPDMVFISLMGNEEAARSYIDTVLQEETWQTLDAVKNGHVVFLPKDLFQFKPNARWYEAYSYLYHIIYDET